MLSQKAKDLFAALEMKYPPVAVKFCFSQPKGVERTGKTLSFCQFVKEAQVTGKQFFTTKEDDDCQGKIALGMVPKIPLYASGESGAGLGVFRTPAANARLHNQIPTLVPGAHNFVIFSPVSVCDFDPDLVICVADISQADIIMRATSYISGDFWESKTSHVMSCVWTYAYPYISGKVNFCITGMHLGMKRRKVYPPGMHLIAIPYQKLDEVVTALGEMEWELTSMSEDPETIARFEEKMKKIRALSPDIME